MANPQAVAEFYRGKTVTIIVGYAPGGGFDTTARVISRHLGKHIPGQPLVVVENMDGAGSLIAANHIYKVAKPDGLTLGAFNEAQVLNQLTAMEGVQFDARNFGWLGNAVQAPTVCTLRSDSPYSSARDLLRKDLAPLILGGTAPGAETDDFPKLLTAALGANIRLVTGYAGTSPIRLAVESKEVEGLCWNYVSALSTAGSWLDSGFLGIPIYQAPAPYEKLLQRYPNAVRAEELTTDENAKRLLRAGTAPSVMAKPLVTPPGVPGERFLALREAYWATMTDPEFLADAQQTKLDVEPARGEVTERIVRELLELDPVIAKRLAEVRK